MEFTLESLGMTQECLQERVIEHIANAILDGTADDFYHDQIEKDLKKLLADRIDEKITAIAEKSLYPHIDSTIEGFLVQQTNAYGEAKGEAKTFTEYLCGKAEEYLTEPLDNNGRTKEECKRGDHSWYDRDPHPSRIVRHVDSYLRGRVEDAMKVATNSVGKVLQEALSKTVTDTLKEMSEKVRVVLTDKR